MERPITSRLKSAWNAFMNRRDPPFVYEESNGSYYRPDRPRMSRGNERTIVTSIINRIAIDVATLDFKHIRVDKNGRFKEEIDSNLNQCLRVSANLDQTGRAFRQDIVVSMLNEGVVAVVPIDTTSNPSTGSYDILSMRTGKVLTWYPSSVQIDAYDERDGQHHQIYMPKANTAIIENPLFAVMNEPNSTLQRLIRKLNLLDFIDEQNSSGKLDLIIQLPYVVKTEARKVQADNRRKEIERQLTGSKYGIAYTDGTEKITQLNRAVDNNLMSQIEYLTRMLYSQLGITDAIMDGTADEATMLNYYNRTIEPIASAIVDEMYRKFLTKTARTQGQSIKFFRDPFKLVPINSIADIADKFTRNEIMTSNELRQIVGMIPSDDPKADELRNKNLNQSSEELKKPVESDVETNNDNGIGRNQNGEQM
jgi:Phage portal protein.